MIIIGLLLVIAAVVFGTDLTLKNRFNIHGIEVFGSSLGVHSAGEVFVIGAITGAVILLGIALIMSGLRHKGSKALTHRRERRDAGTTHENFEQLRSENLELRRELDNRQMLNSATETATPNPTGEAEGVAGDNAVGTTTASSPDVPGGEGRHSDVAR